MKFRRIQMRYKTSTSVGIFFSNFLPSSVPVGYVIVLVMRSRYGKIPGATEDLPYSSSTGRQEEPEH